MSGGVNRGPFEPALMPVSAAGTDAPHGLDRVIASEQAHLTDLARLAGATDDEEALTTKRRDTGRERWLRDAETFARSCARLGVPFEEVESLVDAACTRARIELVFDEKQRLFEAWFQACESLDLEAAAI